MNVFNNEWVTGCQVLSYALNRVGPVMAAQVPFGEGLVAQLLGAQSLLPLQGRLQPREPPLPRSHVSRAAQTRAGGWEPAEAPRGVALESSSGSRAPVGLAEAAVGHPCRGPSAQACALDVLSVRLDWKAAP